MLRRLGQQLAPSTLAAATAAATQQQQQQPLLLSGALQHAHWQQHDKQSLLPWPSQQLQQQLQQYSQRLNPQQQKKQQKQQNRSDKKKGKQDGGGAASAAADSTMFSEDGAAIEPDVTRLVLQAITNVTPLLDVRTVRTATKVSYVPGLMPPKKARSLALHWLVRAADARAKTSKGGYAECLALELLLAYQKRGAARQKRDDIHKLALQNRANMHLRWW